MVLVSGNCPSTNREQGASKGNPTSQWNKDQEELVRGHLLSRQSVFTPPGDLEVCVWGLTEVHIAGKR